MSSLRDATTWKTLTACEAACRRWCAECLRLAAFAIPPTDTAPPPTWRDSLLEGAYLGAGTARALARRTEHDWGGLLMLVGATEQIAGRSAVAWRRIGDPRLRDAITAACEAAIACAALIHTLVPRDVRRSEEQPTVEAA